MKRVIVYLSVTFGLTWTTWIVAGFMFGTFQNGVENNLVMTALVAAGMFCPLIGALIANFICCPQERIDLCFRPKIGQNIKGYLFAWLSPVVIVLIGTVLFFLVNPHLFDPTLQSYIEAVAATSGTSAAELTEGMPPVPIIIISTIVSALGIASFLNMFFTFGEEAGWRGLLFPTLAEKMSERTAAVVSGAIWGIWHAPIIAMGHNYGMEYVGFPIVGILVMILMCTAMGCWFAHMRIQTNTVWTCSLAHGAFNAVANIGVVFCIGGTTLFGPSPLGLVAGIPLLAIGVWSWLHLSKVNPKTGSDLD